MTEFSMDAVTDGLHALGIPAYTEQTGGGCATIYAGPQWNEPGWGPRYAAIAGPGWFAGGPGFVDPRGDTDDFYVGQDDEGITDPVSVKDKAVVWEHSAYVTQIVDLIAAEVAKAKASGAANLDGYTEVWQDWQHTS